MDILFVRRITIVLSSAVAIAGVCLAQSGRPLISFERLFPISVHQKMGLHKLTAGEKEALRSHVENLLITVATKRTIGSGTYAGVGGGHWIQKNVDSGTYMILEDGSLWEIGPLNKVDAMLWLPISSITVVESSDGSPGYDYLLINTDDGEKAHAKYMGQK